MGKIRNHTTIGVKKTTKKRLEKSRAPGQCYDGFLCQMMDLWEEVNSPSLETLIKPYQEREGGADGVNKYHVRRLNTRNKKKERNECL